MLTKVWKLNDRGKHLEKFPLLPIWNNNNNDNREINEKDNEKNKIIGESIWRNSQFCQFEIMMIIIG